MSAEPGNSEVPATDANHVAEPGFKVFAGNLTYATDEAALRNFFGPVADDIVAAQIIKRNHRSAGYGFVTVKTEDAADRAVQVLDKTELDGRPVIVERARPAEEKKPRDPTRPPRNRKFSGRRGSKAVPGEATEPKGETSDAAAPNGDAAATGDEQAAKPKKKKAPKKKAPKTDATAEGAVNGTTEPAAGAAEGDATAKPKRAKKPRSPREPREKRPRGEQPPGEPSTSVLFVANLAFSVDEALLTDWFTSAGITVTSARVVRWKWGTPRKSKGYAFVDVGTPEEQQKAIDALSGKSLNDREVTIRVAVNSEERHEDNAAHDGAEAPAAAEPVAAAA